MTLFLFRKSVRDPLQGWLEHRSTSKSADDPGWSLHPLLPNSSGKPPMVIGSDVKRSMPFFQGWQLATFRSIGHKNRPPVVKATKHFSTRKRLPVIWPSSPKSWKRPKDWRPVRVTAPLLRLSALTTTALDKNPDDLQSYPPHHASRSVKPHQDRGRAADEAPQQPVLRTPAKGPWQPLRPRHQGGPRRSHVAF